MQWCAAGLPCRGDGIIFIFTSLSYGVVNRVCLFLCLLFIGGVSVYDGYLVIRTGSIILDFEQNPVGRWFISNYDVHSFLLFKAVGTVLAIIAMIIINEYCKKWVSYCIVLSMVTFQALLLLYLERN